MTWEETQGKLVKEFGCKDFNDAVAFVNRIAELADDADHHPDITIHDYKHVTVTLTTHDAGGVTEKDVKLGAAIDEAYE